MGLIENIHFAERVPWPYLGIVAVLAVALMIYRTRGRVWLQAVLLLRTLAIIALLLALSAPYTEEIDREARGLVLVDISESMDEQRSDELLDRVDQLQSAGLSLKFVPFGADSTLLPVDSIGSGGIRALRRAWSRLDVGRSNLERGLEIATELNPPMILLVSDGFETMGSAVEFVRSNASEVVPVFPLVPQDADSQQETLKISQLQAPLVAPAQQKISLRVSIQNSTRTAQTGLLTVRQGDQELERREITLPSGRENLFEIESKEFDEGIHEVTAELRPSSPGLNQSFAAAFVAGEQRERVLLLNGSRDDGRFLGRVLEDRSYQVVTFTGGIDAPKAQDLSRYSTVIFNNIALKQLPGGISSGITGFVDQGGGLLMIGGNRSFGLGGYIGTPIEALLPVHLVRPKAEQKRLNIGLVLVVDKSKSMGTGQKLDFAKEAAREVIRNLKDDDLVGVIGFDTTPFKVVALGEVRRIRNVAIQRVGMLYPARRTELLPALDEARNELESAQAGRKHMIVLTDGRIPDGGPHYIHLVKQLRLSGITVSTVMLGADVDVWMLNQMAKEGGGAFYQTTDPRALPRIFLKDVKVQAGERTLKEASQYQVRRGDHRLVSTKQRDFPVVKGYVQTRRRNDAALELVAFAQGKAEPLLASWTRGKGRVAGFTSDANGRWSSPWIPWSGYRSFWSEIVDSVRNKDVRKGGRIEFDLRYFYEQGRLLLDLAVFSEGVDGATTAVITTPSGEDQEVDFSQVARGRYQGVLREVRAGKHEVKLRIGTRPLTPVAFSLSGELFGERRGLGFDRPLLESLASASGGRVNPAITELEQFALSKTIQKDLVPLLLGLALALIIVQLALPEVHRLWRRFSFRRGLAAN